MDSGATGDGLRERGKAKRRAAITRAAFELFAAQGYDATTIAEIAALAEVSPRTVTLYFRSKQDIAFADFDASALRLTETLRDRAAGESVVHALEGWLRAGTACHDETRELELRMFEANPELRAVRAARMAAAMEEGARVIAEATGRAPDGIASRLVATAAAAMVTEIFQSPDGTERDQAVGVAMAFLTAGIEAVAAPAPR
ncbi:helix-turn-helix domain-containing protein [Streptomyces sp. NPDC093085]|uniref:TetR/AcrR family transcriptional regulator n=1 Tax=Streptomyces sp. NPDC093085 TaxID=3155068 RepID=UPI00342F7C46